MPIKIRLVCRPDEENKYSKTIKELDDHFFPGTPYFGSPGVYWWIAFDGDKPVGYAGLDTVCFKHKAFLCRGGVLSKYRGNGIHKRLIKARERMARKLGFKKLVTYTDHNNVASSNSLIKRGYSIYRPNEEWGVDHAIYFCKEL